MNKIRKICWIIANFIIFKWVADYLIVTIQVTIENHWGLSAVPLLFMAIFAEWKVIENIFSELKKMILSSEDMYDKTRSCSN